MRDGEPHRPLDHAVVEGEMKRFHADGRVEEWGGDARWAVEAGTDHSELLKGIKEAPEGSPAARLLDFSPEDFAPSEPSWIREGENIVIRLLFPDGKEIRKKLRFLSPDELEESGLGGSFLQRFERQR